MSTISIRPIGQESPVITGELTHENEHYWFIQLAPGTIRVTFRKDEWELAPVPFVFPTAFGARITGVSGKSDMRYRLVLGIYGIWVSQDDYRWSKDDILRSLTDLRVVEADPDWGEE